MRVDRRLVLDFARLLLLVATVVVLLLSGVFESNDIPHPEIYTEVGR